MVDGAHVADPLVDDGQVHRPGVVRAVEAEVGAGESERVHVKELETLRGEEAGRLGGREGGRERGREEWREGGHAHMM